jgi:uncharacterized protein YodC (DUF2158 family)
MEPELKPGDKVKLLSGGAEMTIRGNHYDVVTNEYSEHIYDCIWYAKNSKGKEEVHYLPCQTTDLVKVKEA